MRPRRSDHRASVWPAPRRRLDDHRDDDCLHQDIEFKLLPAVSGLLADVVDGRVEPFRLPANLVALTVLEGATEHRETDDVGIAGRVGKSLACR